MIDEKRLKNIGRYMSLLLRHAPEKESLDMNSNGFVKVSQLKKVLKINQKDLDWIVENNDKSRFGYDTYKQNIRALQGHSVDIDLGLIELTVDDVPEHLYHGTPVKNYRTIVKIGFLLKMSRQHVHLSPDIDTAQNVGRRGAGKDGIHLFEIRAKELIKSGFKIYKSENGVYLAEDFPLRYCN